MTKLFDFLFVEHHKYNQRSSIFNEGNFLYYLFQIITTSFYRFMHMYDVYLQYVIFRTATFHIINIQKQNYSTSLLFL